MSLAAYARNVFGAQNLVDISIVTLVLTLNGRDAARSSPNTSAGAPASGVYTCTMPSGMGQILLGCETVNDAAIKAELTSLSSANGVSTFTVRHSDGTALASTEEMHVTFLVFNQ